MIRIENDEDLKEMWKLVDELLDKDNPTSKDKNLFMIYVKSINRYEHKIELNGTDEQNDGEQGNPN